jgi:hypothetical protein
MHGSCEWKYDDVSDKWDTECDESFQLIDSAPSANGMRYCPYCGCYIDEVQEWTA